MQASGAKMEEAENVYNDMEDDVNAQARRVVLLEEEVNIGEEKLANTITKLAQMSKEADNIVKVFSQNSRLLFTQKIYNDTRISGPIGPKF